jgi:hypothetical protein
MSPDNLASVRKQTYQFDEMAPGTRVTELEPFLQGNLTVVTCPRCGRPCLSLPASGGVRHMHSVIRLVSGDQTLQVRAGTYCTDAP